MQQNLSLMGSLGCGFSAHLEALLAGGHNPQPEVGAVSIHLVLTPVGVSRLFSSDEPGLFNSMLTGRARRPRSQRRFPLRARQRTPRQFYRTSCGCSISETNAFALEAF